jgi:hypothetical protein
MDIVAADDRTSGQLGRVNLEITHIEDHFVKFMTAYKNSHVSGDAHESLDKFVNGHDRTMFTTVPARKQILPKA